MNAVAASTLLVYALLTVVPGLVLGAALGLRGWLLAGAAPLLTYGLVGTAGIALPAVGVTWSPASFGLTLVVTAAVAAAVRFLVRRRRRPPRGATDPLPTWTWVHHAVVGACVLSAAALGVAVTHAATDQFTAVPQVWDAVFHANATRYIADTGASNPAALQNLNEPTSDSFYYPNAYHVLAATAVMITGGGIPTVLDASTATFAGLFSLSMVALIRQRGGRPALAAATALLAGAFTAFPYDLLPWGTLLPFIVSVALVPAFLAIWSDGLTRGSPPVAVPVALGLGGIGLLALHPSGAVAAALLGSALLVQLWIQRGPRVTDLRVVGITVVTVAGLGAPLLIASLGAAAGPAFDWPATLRPADAFGQILFFSHEQPFPQYWLAVLAFLGLFQRATLRPFVWFVAAGAVFVGLFVMAAAYEGELVALLTRSWWNDRWRFAALWTLPAALLAGAGVVGLRDWLWLALGRVLAPVSGLEGRRRLVASGLVLAAVAVLVIAVTDGLYRARNEARLAQAFTDGPTVSSAERRAFDYLARVVPEGSLVMNDSYDGSALMWALAGVQPVFASPVIAPQELRTMDPERLLLRESFNELDSDPAVRHAVETLNISHAVTCTGFIAPGGRTESMRNLDEVDALQLVYRNEACRIYEVRLPAPGSEPAALTARTAEKASTGS